MKRKILKWRIFLFIILGCAFASLWLTDLSAEQLLFNLHVSMKGVNNNAVWHCLIFACFYAALVLMVLTLLYDWKKKKEPNGKFIRVINKLFAHGKLLTTGIVVACLVFVNYHLEVLEFIEHQVTVSNIYEDEYVDPRDVAMKFPKEKKNLIYIYLESMEVTYADELSGGAQDHDLIPELKRLANENINFSPNEGFGGSLTLPGTTWTMAAMVGQTSGLPLKLPFDGEKHYGNYRDILPGAYSLGNILEKEGYRQVLMMGSDSNFAGRKAYFEQHGNYKVDDYLTAKEDGRIPEDYHVWWGYEDRKLFQYAKEELQELSKSEKPFNLTLLTVDTHFEDGYVCPLCPEDEKDQYASVIRCSSRQVSDFITWIQQQPFYEDTTIVISGDHLSMDSNFFHGIKKNYSRQVYNCIINPAVKNPKEYEKNRSFTTLDLFPTTLAAMGVRIEGDQLGLGTNLFSGKPTLTEIDGFEALSEELSKNSPYYNRHFLYEH